MTQQVMTSVLQDPLPVEFTHAGGWYPGFLLGWRTEGPDHCRLRVQCVVGGLRRTSWMALTDLRLPTPVQPPPADDVHHPGTGHLTGERPLAYA